MREERFDEEAWNGKMKRREEWVKSRGRGKGEKRGRGKGKKRWSGGGVWTRVEEDPVRDFGDRRAMLGPRLAGEGRVEGDDKLAGGMDRMRGKVVGGTMETMVGGEIGVEGPGWEVVKGEIGLWEQVVPAIRREGDVGGREDGDKMAFGSTNCSFRRVGAMVKMRDVLKGEVGREEERSEARRGFVVKKNVRQTKGERESGRKRQQT